MPDKGLIEFIASQQRLGAHIEKIRSDLRANDWTDSDIDAALAALDVKEKNRQVREQRFKKFVIVFFVTVLICAGVLVIYIALGHKVPIVAAPTPTEVAFPDLSPQAPVEATTTPTIVPVVDDIQAVKTKFTEQFPGAIYVRAQKETDYMVVSGIFKEESGNATTKDLVFTKANDVWTFDTGKTDERIARLQAVASSTIPADSARPKVIGVKVLPQPPAINSKDTVILVSIKNVGSLSAEGFTFITTYDTRGSFESAVQTPVAPGQTLTWRYEPYPVGEKYTDKKGKHRITIALPDQDPFTQEFDLY
jgi:hypothetical protein